LCRNAATTPNWFVGHIGGDDFFIGLKDVTEAEALGQIGTLIRRFSSDAESFYDAEARAKGGIIASDREGNPKTFPLLSASAVLLMVPPNPSHATVDDVSTAIAARKKEAKLSPTKIVVTRLDRR
jgi:GGDEF domain-containing protein